MILFVIRRCLALAAVMVGASILLFVLTRGLPGEPVSSAALHPRLDAALDLLAARAGVELTPVSQYLNWLSAALHGDLGRSRAAAPDVASVLLQRLPVTLQLVTASFVLALIVAVPAGITAARRAGGALDRLCRILGSVGASLPVFWLAMLAILGFAVTLRWLPAGGYVASVKDPVGWVIHLLMPATVLAIGCAARIQRALRDTTMDALARDHLVVARAFGASERRVFWTQVLRHALAPTLAGAGIAIGQLLAGAVLVETVFDLPGAGRLLVESIRARDYGLMHGVALAGAAAVLLASLAADSLRALLDRRARLRP